MSATSTPADSPVSAPIQPLHNPSQAAHIVVPQAPLGNVSNGTSSSVPGLGMKALLAKKMAKSNNPKFVSPTDNLMTPVTRKLNAAKQKRFTRGAKPMAALSPTLEPRSSEEQEDHSDINSDSDVKLTDNTSSEMRMKEDDNPF